MVPALYFRIHKEFTQPRWLRLKNQFTSNLKISPLFIYTQSCLYPLLELGSLSWTLRGQRSAFQKIIFRCPRHSFRQEMISTCRAFFYLLITRQKKRAFQTLFKQKKFENTGCTGCLVFVSTENGTFISKTMALPWRHRFRKVEPQLSCGRINTVNIIWTFNHSLCTYGSLVNFIHEITWFPWPKFP